jgi:hypothetical protein
MTPLPRWAGFFRPMSLAREGGSRVREWPLRELAKGGVICAAHREEGGRRAVAVHHEVQLRTSRVDADNALTGFPVWPSLPAGLPGSALSAK